MTTYDFQWPLQWLFGSHKEKLDAIDLNSDNDNFLNSDNDFDEPIKKLNWRNLYYMPGWESSHWLQIEENIPADPGIYVIVHEAEKATLYVGQAQNLRKRVLSPRHHKIPKILEMYRAEGTYSHRRDFPLHHDTNCVDYDVIIFWKIVEKPYYNGSLSKTLVWYEALAIGLLCPIMQGDLEDIEKTIWAVGMQEFE